MFSHSHGHEGCRRGNTTGLFDATQYIGLGEDSRDNRGNRGQQETTRDNKGQHRMVGTASTNRWQQVAASDRSSRVLGGDR